MIDNEPPDGFVEVAKVGDLAPGTMKWIAVEGVRWVLAHVEGAFYAIRDVCGHRNAPLSRGKLDGYRIECPLHFAIFDVRTGKLVDGPVSADVPTREVRIANGRVYIRR